ncbi:MAG: hypothetical protein ACE5EI_04710 [Thermodesulfobacteriota bacterium]
MKKFVLGFLLGVLALALFVYYGGGDYLKAAGSRTEEAGKALKGYEKKMKRSIEGVREKAGETVERTKEKVQGTREKARELVP